MPAKVKDDEGRQLYSRSFPDVFPDGSEFSVYSSPDNRRVLLKHASGSHIEFKEDGSVFIKANKQLIIDSGRETDEPTIFRCDSDLVFEVTGDFKVEANRFDLEAPKGTYINSSGGELKTSANNTIIGAHANMSIQPTKSLYISTGEMRESVTTKTTEAGSLPNGISLQ